MTARTGPVRGDGTTGPATQPRPDAAGALVTRRRVLVTGAVVAGTAALTASCGAASGAAGSSTPTSASGTTLATSDVPSGGGVVLTDRQVVVTQPTPGVYKAFSAICTHQGCPVTQVANGAIVCPCHMGTFSIVDGSVLGGPPPAPLPEVPITVSGSTITFG